MLTFTLTFSRLACSQLGSRRSFSLASTLCKYEGGPKFTLPFPERHVTFTTCGELYEDWKRDKTYRVVSDGPLVCRDVPYVDTAPGEDRIPIVVMLHGSPGRYLDFTPQITFLQNQGARVIAPNFPDFDDFPSCIFKHTALEKYHFVKDFLKAIDLSRVDMFVAHSSAIYPMLHLYNRGDKNNPDIGALAFLNPGCHKRIKALHPPWAYNLIFELISNHKYGYSLIKAMFKFIMVTLRPPLRVDSFDRVILAGQSQMLSGWQTVEHDYALLKKSQPPTLIAFSDNDVLMNKDITYEMLHHILEIPPSDLCRFNENGDLVQKGADNKWVKVLSFAKGSHYVFWKYPDLINQNLLELLSKSRTQPQQQQQQHQQQQTRRPAKQRISQT